MLEFSPPPDSLPLFEKIFDVLFELGITPKYVGFSYSSFAIYLAIQQPERLLLITKWLYPDVAKQYLTKWQNVERGIRTVVAVAWELRPEKLSYIAKCNLTHKPTNAQFIAILANHIQASESNDPMFDPITQIS